MYLIKTIKGDITKVTDVQDVYKRQHLDWIKLEKHLDEDCVLPMNVFRQMIEKLQNPT